MPIVTTPDGQRFEFPEGMAQADMKAALDRHFAETAPKPDKSGNMPGETDWGRVAAEMAGGALGGAVGAGSGLLTGPGAVVASPVGAAAGTGLGASMGGQAYDLAKKYLFGAKDDRGLGERSMQAAYDVGINATVPAVFDRAVDAAKGLVAPIKNRLAGANAKQLLTDFQSLGVTPSAGAISGNRAVQQTEKALAGLPGSARIMQEQTAGQLDQLKSATNALANRFGPVATQQGAGETIKSGASNAAQRFRDTSRALYDRLDQFINKDSLVPVKNSVDFLKGQIDEYGAESALGQRFNRGISDVFKRVSSDAGESGAIPFKTLKRLRSDIGGMLSDPVLVADDISHGQLKQLYGALSQDLDSAATAAGPQAKKAYDFANRYYSVNMARGGNVETINRVLKTGTDEQAFTLAMSGAGQGGSNLTRLRMQMKPEEWDVVSGTVLGRMGRATPGAQNVAGDEFSVNTFLTNWNKLAPEAKSALFGGSRYSELRPALDRLTRVTAALKDTERMANPSGTAQALNITTMLGALGGGTVGLASGGVGGAAAGALAPVATTILAPKYAAKLITNPRVVNWLADGLAVASRAPNKMGTQLVRLAAIAKEDPEVRDAIQGWFAAMEAGSQANNTAQ